MSISERWLHYRELCLTGIPDAVVEECRQAFSAGAGEMFTAIMEIVRSDPRQWQAKLTAVADEVEAVAEREVRRARGMRSDG
jgi:hypothetical protein